MPVSPPSLCTAPGCGALVHNGGRCPDCRKQGDKARGNAHARGYDARWSAFSKRYLKAHPFCECEECERLPEWSRPASTDVDHMDGLGPTGPRGYDATNCQALSHPCHSRKTATQDGGFGHAPSKTSE